MQILAAFLLGLGMVAASFFVGRHRNTATKLAAMSAESWPWRCTRAIQRALLYGGRAVHPLRRGSGFHHALGGGLPQAACAYRCSPLLRILEMVVYLGFVAVGSSTLCARHPKLEPGQGGPLTNTHRQGRRP